MPLGTNEIAQLCHEVNRAYCESIGDDSQVPYKDALDWQKESVINGVEHHINNPDASVRSSHENWLARKEADGWSYGEEKDAEIKEHPNMVPFDDLPQEQQTKDFIFKAIVNTLRP